MSRRTTSPAAVVIAGLVVACADAPWQPPPYETAIKRYYEAHASERNGQCLAPYIDGFTTLQVVEDTPQRVVIDARFLYRDRIKDGGDQNNMMLGCTRYGARSFVLTRSDDRYEVVAMTGLRRN
jgi:hypothetical protein